MAPLEAELKSPDVASATKVKLAREEGYKRGYGEGRQEGWFEGHLKGALDFINSVRFTNRMTNALLHWMRFGMRVGFHQAVKSVGNPDILQYSEPDYTDDCDEPEPVIPEYISPPSSPLRDVVRDSPVTRLASAELVEGSVGNMPSLEDHAVGRDLTATGGIWPRWWCLKAYVAPFILSFLCSHG